MSERETIVIGKMGEGSETLGIRLDAETVSELYSMIGHQARLRLGNRNPVVIIRAIEIVDESVQLTYERLRG